MPHRSSGNHAATISFFYNLAPNPLKVALMLEETGLPHTAVPIDTRRGDQRSPGFRAINPNGKVPAIQDGEATVFDSNAILLYLAEKTGRFLPPDTAAARGDLWSWLMFVAKGVGPFSGQAVHFRLFAPGDNPSPRKRYDFEARRHWQVIEDRLDDRPLLLGDSYAIVGITLWGWAPRIPAMLGDEGAMSLYPNIARLMAAIDARPAAARVEALKQRHAFTTEFDEAAMRSLYPQIFAPDPV